MAVLRMCAVCRNRYEKENLIRIVKFKDGDIKIDKSGKMQGRGMYICKNKECLAVAEKRKVIERAFSGRVLPCVYEELTEMSEDNE